MLSKGSILRKLAAMLGCLALLFMVACGNQSSDTGSTDSGSQQATEEPADSGNESQDGASENVAYDEEKAKAAYQSCVGCHGENLEGSVGPALKGTGLSADEILEVIENGKGQMPGGLVTGEDAKNLAAWLADQ